MAKSIKAHYPDYSIIHTDSYLQYGHYGSDDPLKIMTGDVIAHEGKLVVEGSLCYRLLRDGLLHRMFNPDMIISVVATTEVRHQRRPDKDYSQMDVIYRGIWREYLSLRYLAPNPPEIVEYETQ